MPAPAAPPPAAPPANPPANPPPPPPAPIPTGAEDPQLKTLFDDLGIVLAAPPPPAAPPAPSPSTAAPSPAAAPASATSPGAGTPTAPPAAPAPAVPPAAPLPGTAAAGAPTPAATPAPVVVKRQKPIAEVVEDVVRKVIGEAGPGSASPPPATAQTPPAPAAAPAEDPFLASLIPEEREAYDLAKWAEENAPEFKGQGLSGKFLNFYKAVEGYITAERAKDPNRKFDDEDEAFQSFVESSRPEIEPAKWEKLKTDRLVAQVEENTTRKVSERFTRENEELRHRQTLLEKKPLIEGRLTRFQDNVGKLMLAEKAVAGHGEIIAGIAQKIGTDGVDKALEEDPIFTPIVVTAYNHGQTAAAEFLAMTNGLKEFKPENQVQSWLIRFIRGAGEHFAAHGGDKRTRTDPQDGMAKTFLPRGKFNELLQKNPDEAAKHWSFSDEDVLAMIERNTKDHIATLVKSETERLTKAGYIRPPPSTPAPVPGNANPGQPNPTQNGAPGAPSAASPPPQPVGSPRAGVTAAPGQGVGTVPQNSAMSDQELALLGIKKAA